MRTPLWAAAVFLLAADLAAPAGERKSAGDAAKADTAAFKAYLAKHYPGKKWKQGPTRIDTPETRKAYGSRRFYYVYSTPPMEPGVTGKYVYEEYIRQFEEYRKNYVSLTVEISKGEEITPLHSAGSFNTGLLKVQSEDDVKTAAAAILSLYGSFRVGPGPVKADSVKVTRNSKGWSGGVKTFFFQGTVNFDADGKCTSISKFYTGPFPQ
jgi:hypothetical protein